MEIRVGNTYIKNNTIKSIAEIAINDYIVYVFPGALSENDFLIKYSKTGTRKRTPKHIHWVTDILMKLQGNPVLTKEFLQTMKEFWDNCSPIERNTFDNIKNIVNVDFNAEYFSSFNQYGEYDIDFVFALIRLLSVQEKTNREDAHLFGEILEQLLEDELDIFSIMSKAGLGRR